MFSVFSFFVCVCVFFMFLIFVFCSFFILHFLEQGIIFPFYCRTTPLQGRSSARLPSNFRGLSWNCGRASERAEWPFVCLERGRWRGRKASERARDQAEHTFGLSTFVSCGSRRDNSNSTKRPRRLEKKASEEEKKARTFGPHDDRPHPDRSHPDRTPRFFFLLFLGGSASDRADCSFARLGGREERVVRLQLVGFLLLRDRIYFFNPGFDFFDLFALKSFECEVTLEARTTRHSTSAAVAKQRYSTNPERVPACNRRRYN